MYVLKFKNREYDDVYDEFNLEQGCSLIITNKTNSSCFIDHHTVEDNSTVGFPVLPCESALVHGVKDKLIYVVRAKAAGRGSNTSTIVGNISDERGVNPNKYYYIITSNGTQAATGVIHAYWEEITEVPY